MRSSVSQLVMSGGSFPNQTCTEMSTASVTLLWSAMGNFFFFLMSVQYFLFIYLMCILNTCLFFSLPGPCMFSEASLGYCSTMYLFTAHPAARPLWQRRVVCKLGQGSVASGTEVAASPGSRAWLMEASHLSHSAPPNQVRKTVKPLLTLFFYGQQGFLYLPKLLILHASAF